MNAGVPMSAEYIQDVEIARAELADFLGVHVSRLFDPVWEDRTQPVKSDWQNRYELRSKLEDQYVSRMVARPILDSLFVESLDIPDTSRTRPKFTGTSYALDTPWTDKFGNPLPGQNLTRPYTPPQPTSDAPKTLPQEPSAEPRMTQDPS
jgi:hypothetical protein